MSIFKKAANFITEVKQELSKVAWSSRSELLGATVVVIATTALLAVFIGVLDLLLSKILSVLFK